MTLGFALLLSGSILLLLHEHIATLRAWDRPAWARGGGSLALFRVGGWTLLLGGLAVLAWRAPVTGLVTASILAGLGAWRRWARSAAYLARGLRREVARLRRAQPDRSEQDLLRDVVLARHPRWGEDLASQIVTEQRTAERVAEMLVRMERGVPLSGSRSRPTRIPPRSRRP